ncbi:MAG: class I SAM-dependent methyltransferase [Terracidiphilus sp.]
MKSAEAAKFWEANAEYWTRFVRAGYDVYRDALNTPAFLAMLPGVRGLFGIDIGCGEGAETRKLARLGAHMQAIDVAPTLIRHAEATEKAAPLGILYQVANGMDLPFAGGTFDFATAFMSLMDMPDHGLALKESARVLRPGGFFQFSIIHPCFAPPHRRVLRDGQGKVVGLEIGRYFEPMNGQINEWMFSAVPAKERGRTKPFRAPMFHRTLSSWVDLICAAGLSIEKFGEPSASRELADAQPAVADTLVAPLFLHVRVRKPV